MHAHQLSRIHRGFHTIELPVCIRYLLIPTLTSSAGSSFLELDVNPTMSQKRMDTSSKRHAYRRGTRIGRWILLDAEHLHVWRAASYSEHHLVQSLQHSIRCTYNNKALVCISTMVDHGCEGASLLRVMVCYMCTYNIQIAAAKEVIPD